MRGKVAGELVGLAVALRRPAQGACVVILSHLLFWLGGAARACVAPDGSAAPVPGPVARMIATADAVVLSLAALAAFGSTARLRAVGAAGFGVAAACVCAEQVPKAMRRRCQAGDERRLRRRALAEGRAEELIEAARQQAADTAKTGGPWVVTAEGGGGGGGGGGYSLWRARLPFRLLQ